MGVNVTRISYGSLRISSECMAAGRITPTHRCTRGSTAARISYLLGLTTVLLSVALVFIFPRRGGGLNFTNLRSMRMYLICSKGKLGYYSNPDGVGLAYTFTKFIDVASSICGEYGGIEGWAGLVDQLLLFWICENATSRANRCARTFDNIRETPVGTDASNGTPYTRSRWMPKLVSSASEHEPY